LPEEAASCCYLEGVGAAKVTYWSGNIMIKPVLVSGPGACINDPFLIG
jgi:hypothetical protein